MVHLSDSESDGMCRCLQRRVTLVRCAHWTGTLLQGAIAQCDGRHVTRRVHNVTLWYSLRRLYTTILFGKQCVSRDAWKCLEIAIHFAFPIHIFIRRFRFIGMLKARQSLPMIDYCRLWFLTIRPADPRESSRIECQIGVRTFRVEKISTTKTVCDVLLCFAM